VVDVTRFEEVQAAAAAAEGRFGRLHLLVNNAGITGNNRPSWELDEADWRRVIDIDLTGVFLCCKAVVPRLLSAGYGRVVNIASIAGKEGNPNAAHYSSAKAGVIAFTKSLGKELAKTGVVANCVAPAVIETDILQQMTPQHVEYMLSRIPMGRFGKKEEAAALVAWLCSPDCSFSTGAVFDLSGGRATY
jgi:3-oxoacyl-[acyl-carrier protein] reductase